MLSISEYYPEIKGTLSIQISRVLYSERSPFQKIDVVESPILGKMLFIDDLIMLTERDEFVYHEMIAHVPLFTHPQPEQILIIGGGDGGTVRECLKHPTVQRIDLVDIDEMVSQACIKYIPSVGSKLLSEKVHLHFQDGVQYVQDCQEKYDVIIVDSTDPISVGEGLFTPQFYRNCYNLLLDNGLLVAQSESPAWAPELVKGIARKLKDIFPKVLFYQAHIPTYPSGHWAFGLASKRYHPLKDFQEKRYQELKLDLKYYNNDLHFGAFALPNFFRRLIDAD